MIQIIIDQFSNLTPLLWASQICGNIAFILYAISTQLNKKKFLIFSLFFFVFFMLEQIFAFLWAGIITNIISLTRSIILLVYLSKNKETMPRWINDLLIVIMWASTILLFIFNKDESYTIINAFLPAILATIFAITQNNKSIVIVKLGLLVNEIGFFIYFLINNLPFSYMREVILVIAIIIGILREIFKKKIEN